MNVEIITVYYRPNDQSVNARSACLAKVDSKKIVRYCSDNTCNQECGIRLHSASRCQAVQPNH